MNGAQFGQIFRAGIRYSSAFRMYAERFVRPEDRQNMLYAGSRYNIPDELKDKSFVIRYDETDGVYCEVKFAKTGDPVYPKAAAPGFSEVGISRTHTGEMKPRIGRNK